MELLSLNLQSTSYTHRSPFGERNYLPLKAACIAALRPAPPDLYFELCYRSLFNGLIPVGNTIIFDINPIHFDSKTLDYLRKPMCI